MSRDNKEVTNCKKSFSGVYIIRVHMTVCDVNNCRDPSNDVRGFGKWMSSPRTPQLAESIRLGQLVKIRPSIR
jgi:hypothetical protein